MPCTLEWPRSAFTPPPGMPMLPSSSWIMAIERMFWAPVVCCVQPSAYSDVIVRSGVEVEPIISQICRNFALGVPVMRSTISGV